MNVVRAACLLGIAVLGAAIEHGHAEAVRLSDLLDGASSFDGLAVALEGTLGRLHAHVTRKGIRYYTFQLVQDGRDVLVSVQERPSCNAGALVRVQGRFDGPKKRVDATTVTCD
jgi:hypothetical protein